MSVTLNNLLLYLCTNPEVEKKLREEIKKEIFDSYPGNTLDEIINYDIIKDLPYLTWTLKEALRMMPPTPGSAEYKPLKDI